MRKLIVIIVLALTASTAYGQFFTIGPKIGISSSSIKVKDVESIASGNSSVGFHAGLFSRITIAGFYVQPELTFTSAGGEIKYSDSGNGNLDQITELTYNKLDVPVMLGMRFAKFLRINAGPSFSLILSEDARNKGTVDEVKSNYKNATVGYQAGVGLDIGKITLDLRYEGGLSKLGDEINIANESFATDMRNNLWLFSLGLKLF